MKLRNPTKVISTKVDVSNVGNLVTFLPIAFIKKCAMKVEVTISDSTSREDEDDTNFLALFASSNVVDPLTAILDA